MNIIFVFAIDSTLLLLSLVSSTAFIAVTAVSTLGYQISYFIPLCLRCTVARHTFVQGEFNLGRFGQWIATVASVWLLITSLIMLLPTEYPITVDNMNYAVVIITAVALFASIYWIVSARHWFVGPKRLDTDATPLLAIPSIPNESRLSQMK